MDFYLQTFVILAIRRVVKPDFTALISAANRLFAIGLATSSKPEAAIMAETLFAALHAMIGFSRHSLDVRGKLLSCVAPLSNEESIILCTTFRNHSLLEAELYCLRSKVDGGVMPINAFLPLAHIGC